MSAKKILGAIGNGMAAGDEFYFEFMDIPVGCQITSWNGKNNSASCVNIWMDGSTMAHISERGMSLNYCALMVCSSVVEHAVERDYPNAQETHDEFWESIEQNAWLNAIWMENADQRKKEEEE